MNRNRICPFWTFVAALIVSCGCCQGVSTYSLKSQTSDKTPIYLRALQREDKDEQMEKHADPSYLGEWYLENVWNPSHGMQTQAMNVNTQAATTQSTARHDLFWENYAKKDDWKDLPIFSNNKTLTNFHYLVLPIWWSNEDENDPNLAMNVSVSILEETKTFFDEMSWGKFTMSWDILPQQKFSVSNVNPDFDETKNAAFAILEGLGRVRGDGSFDGVMLIHSRAQNGPLDTGGGWASVNGIFVWMTYNLKYKVVRHEVGHNFGHPHHQSMLGYRYDEDRWDGFDMMSGGNGYEVSHFHPASKWFFDWIPDSSIIILQPEGATEQCPDCEDGGTYTIHTFDDSAALPQENQAMAIQIPIMSEGSKTFFSYWLSYRTGVDGDASGGLSVHVGWFNLGGTFGANFDSLNYDAHGDTESVLDSFVLPGTCYIVEPPVKLLEVNPFFAKQVIPQVCVDSLNVGSDVTVNVTFLDPDLIYEPSTRAVQPEQEFECSFDGSSFITYSMTANISSLIHITNTGSDGIVHMNVCSTNITAKAYDNYPLLLLDSYPDFGLHPEYGAFPAFIDETCEAETYVNEAWLLVASAVDQELFVWCQMTSCFQNHYKSGNVCAQCPENHIAPPGSLSISACEKCLDGFILLDPQANECSLSDEYDESIDTASGWRIWAPSTLSTLWWVVQVKNMKMYPTSDCTGTEVIVDITTVSSYVESGNGGGGPEKAFEDDGKWEGRRDADKLFYVGVILNQDVTVKCMRIQFGTNYMKEIRVQAFDEIEQEWQNVWIQKNVMLTGGVINVGVGVNLTTCDQNQYNSNNECWNCPANHLAPPGSTDITDCQKCLDGYGVAEPNATECTISEEYDLTIAAASGWRIWAPSTLSTLWSVVQVKNMKMYPTSDCTGTEVVSSSTNVTYLDSGNAGSSWGPHKAFQESGTWEGRRDADKLFYLGVEFIEDVSVQCMRIQFGTNYMKEIRVQAFDEIEQEWQNVWIQKNVMLTDGVIEFGWVAVDDNIETPSLEPSETPSLEPSETPSLEVSETPSVEPSLTPTVAQTSSGSPVLTLEPSLTPTLGLESHQCKNNEHNLMIKLKTDSYGGETSWKITKDDGSGNFDEVIDIGESYSNNKEYTENVCLSEGRYTFTFIDSYGDGICCEYGNGFYEVFLDGDLIASGGNFAGTSESTIFEAVPSSQPSLEPSVAPSDLASVVPSQVPSMDPTWLSNQPSVDGGTLMPSASFFPTIVAGDSPDAKLLIMFLRALVAFINTFLATISKSMGKLLD